LGIDEEFDKKILLNYMEFGFSQTKRKFKDKCENLNENKIA
jgi:hypothetical protein